MGKKENKTDTSVHEFIEHIEKELKNKTPQEIVQLNAPLVNMLEIPELSFYFVTKFNDYLDEETYSNIEFNIINKGNLELAALFSQKIKNTNNLYTLEQKLMDSKDPKPIYLFLINNNSPHKKEIEQRLQETKSAEYNCKYAQHLLNNSKDIIQLKIEKILNKNKGKKLINNKDYKEIIDEILQELGKYEKIVLESKNPKWMYELCVTIINKNYLYNRSVKNFLSKIIECGNEQYIYMILKEISQKLPNINISEYKEKIIEQKNPKLIYRMASLLNDKKNDDLENAILNTDDITMIFIYAKNIQNIDINYFTQRIIKTHNYELMIKYSKEVLNKKNEDINDIQDTIIKSGKTEIITKFAFEVIGADVYKCFKAISKTKDVEKMCEFVIQAPELDETRLSFLIELRNNPKWSSIFMKYFPDVDSEIHRQIMQRDKPNFLLQPRSQPKQRHVKIKPKKQEPPKTLEEAWNSWNIKTILAFAKKYPDYQEEISRRIIKVNNPKWSWEFMQRFEVELEAHKRIIGGTPYQEKYEKLFGKPQDLQKKQVKQKKKRIGVIK